MQRPKRFVGGIPSTSSLRPIREINKVANPSGHCQASLMERAMKTLPFAMKPEIDRCVESVCQELPEEIQQNTLMQGAKIFIEYLIFFVWLMLFVAFKFLKAVSFLIWRFSKMEGPINSELKIAVVLGVLLVIGATIARSKWQSSKLENKLTCHAKDKSAKVRAEAVAQATKEAAKVAEVRTAAVKAAEKKAAALQAAAAHASPLAEAEEDDCHCVDTKSNPTNCIGDAEARKIFSRSKLYAIPTEMKQPPHYLVHLKNVLVSLLHYAR